MIIKFADWNPDSPDLGGDDTNAQNCIPGAEGYRALPSMAVYSNALGNRCQGATVARDNAGNVYNIAGDKAGLYTLSQQAYQNVSKSGGYALTTEERWEFAQWGNTVIATSYTDNPQVLTLGGAAFMDLPGTPPKARHIGIVRDFVVLGNINDSTNGPLPTRIQWSGINDSTAWGVNPQTMADHQDLQGDGWIQAIIGGEYGVIFQERSIWRMTFVGSPAVFRFDLVEKNRGALAPGSVVNLGRKSYYLSYDGFYVTDGLQSQPIGLNKVNKWFFADLDQTYINRISAAIDPVNSLVFWAYPAAGNTNGNPNKVIIYNWATDKWSYGVMDCEMIFRSASQGYTLEGLGSIYQSLDSIPITLDSKSWMGGVITLSAFDPSHQLNFLNGPAQTATLDTLETQMAPGRKAIVRNVRPLVQDGTASIQVGTKNNQGDAVTWNNSVTQDSDGKCEVRVQSRYQRFRVVTNGSFSHALGVEVDAVPGGVR